MNDVIQVTEIKTGFDRVQKPPLVLKLMAFRSHPFFCQQLNMIDVLLDEHIVIIVLFISHEICTRMNKTSKIKHAAHAMIWLRAAGFWYHQGLEGNFCYAALPCPEGLAGFDPNGSTE